MAPKVRKKQIAQRASRHSATQSTPTAEPNPTYPWPREQEGVPIDIEDLMLFDVNVEGWDKEKARAYNALLAIDIQPTLYVHPPTLAQLGLDDDVQRILSAIGIPELCTKPQILIPELVRQALTSAEIYHENEHQPWFKNTHFRFMAGGKHCSLPLVKFKEIYDISDDPREVSLLNSFPPTKIFWDLIASGDFKPCTAYQSHIRNPSVRIIAKVLSNLLFAKEQTSKVTNGELQMLYSGLEDQIRAARAGIPITKVLTNPGYLLAAMFVAKKCLLMRGSQTKDRCGSLLSPLFLHFRIDHLSLETNYEPYYIDIPYLIKCHILCDESTYMFQDKAGTQLFCKLPQTEITSLDKFENIRFLPEPEHLCDDPLLIHPGTEDVEDVTPDPNYDLEDIEDGFDDATYRRWMIDSQCKNNSLLKRILKTIAGGCFKGQQEREDEQEQSQRTGHRPGKEPAGATSGEERLPRNRRIAGQSGSGESD
ncbi:hypothetical protein Bca4012_063141 [Brassica carinata]